MRFSDILASRVQGLGAAFAQAMNEYGYNGGFRGVYPIKVNQQRHVVEEIVQYGRRSTSASRPAASPSC